MALARVTVSDQIVKHIHGILKGLKVGKVKIELTPEGLWNKGTGSFLTEATTILRLLRQRLPIMRSHFKHDNPKMEGATMKKPSVQKFLNYINALEDYWTRAYNTGRPPKLSVFEKGRIFKRAKDEKTKWFRYFQDTSIEKSVREMEKKAKGLNF